MICYHSAKSERLVIVLMPDSLPINDELRELFLKIICSPNATNNFPEIPNIRPVLKRTIQEMLRPNSHCRVNSTIGTRKRKDAERIAKAQLVQILNPSNDHNQKLLIEACWDFVDYQLNSPDICKGKENIFRQEGFQIGSPWHGDVINAPVLFLSINPAITHRCFFPRWHVQEDVFTLAGLDNNGSPYYDLTDIHGRKIPNVISDGEIYSYLTNRFQDTPLTPGAGNLSAVLVNNNNCCVRKPGKVEYWYGMKEAMRCLLGDSCTNTKRLMRSVLSAEIIFWGTKREKNVNNSMLRLQYFWNSFVDPLLRNCGAKILFLVGATSTLQAFNTVTGNKLKNAKAMNWNLGGKNFAVAAMNNPAGQAGSNHVAAIAALKGLGDPQVQQAINKAQYMYNN